MFEQQEIISKVYQEKNFEYAKVPRLFQVKHINKEPYANQTREAQQYRNRFKTEWGEKRAQERLKQELEKLKPTQTVLFEAPILQLDASLLLPAGSVQSKPVKEPHVPDGRSSRPPSPGKKKPLRKPVQVDSSQLLDKVTIVRVDHKSMERSSNQGSSVPARASRASSDNRNVFITTRMTKKRLASTEPSKSKSKSAAFNLIEGLAEEFQSFTFIDPKQWTLIRKLELDKRDFSDMALKDPAEGGFGKFANNMNNNASMAFTGSLTDKTSPVAGSKFGSSPFNLKTLQDLKSLTAKNNPQKVEQQKGGKTVRVTRRAEVKESGMLKGFAKRFRRLGEMLLVKHKDSITKHMDPTETPIALNRSRAKIEVASKSDDSVP